MAVQHLAFDLDGTLVDTRQQIVESLLACLPPKQRLDRVRSSFNRNAHKSPKVLLKQYGITNLDAYWRHHGKLREHSRLFFSDTTRTLKMLLEAGISLSMITSLPNRPVRRLLELHALEPFFGRVDTFASQRFRKPSPKLLAVHLQDLGLFCEDAAYLGDSEGDMRMATQAGSSAWGVGWGYASESTLRRAGATRIVRSLHDLPELFSQCRTQLR